MLLGISKTGDLHHNWSSLKKIFAAKIIQVNIAHSVIFFDLMTLGKELSVLLKSIKFEL